MITNEYTMDPVKYNNLNQAQKLYVGVDNLHEKVLPKGTLIVALSGPKDWMVGNYFISIDQILNGNFNSIDLCQGVQVSPFYAKGMAPQFKTNARVYLLNEDIKVAWGETTQNPHFGTGGSIQYVVPNGKEMIISAINDTDRHNTQHGLIPINLNDFKADPRVSEEAKLQIEKIREVSSGRILDDGSIMLNNKEISMDAYEHIAIRTEIHELTSAYTCMLKEYNDGLKMHPLDIEGLKNLRHDIGQVKKDLDTAKFKFLDSSNYIGKNPNLLEGFSKEQREHLLNMGTCCPTSLNEMMEYLEKRGESLEKGFNEHEKKELGIVDKENWASIESDLKMEKAINIAYQNYSAIDPYGIIPRELLFVPQKHIAMELEAKRNMFCYLKGKDDMLGVLDNEKDDKIKEFIKSEIDSIDKYISKFEKDLSHLRNIVGDIPSMKYDNIIKYLFHKIGEKYGDIKGNRNFSTDSSMEDRIDRNNNEIIKEVKNYLSGEKGGKMKDLERLCNIRDFCDISKDIASLKELNKGSNTIKNSADICKKISELKKIQFSYIKNSIDKDLHVGKNNNNKMVI